MGIVFYELFQLFSTGMERVLALTELRESAHVDDEFRLKWPDISLIIEQMIPIDSTCRSNAFQILAEFRRCAANYRCKEFINNNKFKDIDKNYCLKVTEASSNTIQILNTSNTQSNVVVSSNKSILNISNGIFRNQTK